MSPRSGATSVLRQSDLLAVLPARLVAEASPLNWLTAQPLPIETPQAVLYLIWHRRSNALAPMMWFRDRVFDAVTAMNAEAGRANGTPTMGGALL